MDRSLYTPSPWHIAYHQSTADWVMGGGSAGPGKSLGLLMDPLVTQAAIEHMRMTQVVLEGTPDWLAELIKKHPIKPGESEGHALHMRRTMPQLRETLDRAHRMFKKFDPGVVWSAEFKRFTFSSGYKYTFGHCRQEEDYEDYLSQQYCVAEGTRVVMGDGRLCPIERIEPGQMVQTMEGPRRVLATWDSGVKPCVRASISCQGEIVGTQVHPSTHPVLLWPNWRSLASGMPESNQSERTAPESFPTWHDYESLLGGLPESPVKRVSQLGARNDSVSYRETRLESPPLPVLSVPVVLHEQTLRRALARRHSPIGYAEPSASLSPSVSSTPRLRQLLPVTQWGQPPSAEEFLQVLRHSASPSACDAAYVPTETGTATGSPEDCSTLSDPRGARLRVQSGNDPASAQPLDDAAGRIQSESPPDGQADAPGCSPWDDAPSSYRNFYTGELRPLTEGVRMGTATLAFVGERQTYDLTVEDANHYVTETGLVSSQTWLGLDEAYQFTEKQFEELDGRVRSSDPVLVRLLRTRLMTNPAPGWIKKVFVDPAPEGNVILRKKVTDPATGESKYKTILFLPARLDDNPDKAFVENYKFKLLAKPAHIRARYLYGDWNAQEGGYFEDSYVPLLHVIKPFKIPRDWPKFRSMDWGYRAPGTMGWWALDNEDILYRFYGYDFQNTKDEGVADRAIEIEKRFGFWYERERHSRLTGVADTQLWEERGDSGRSKAETFAAKGIPFQPADKANLQRGCERLLERLRDYDENKPPRIQIFEGCHKTREMFAAIQVDPNDSEVVDKKSPLKHWLDEAAYAAARASRGAGSIVMEMHAFDREEEDEPAAVAAGGGFGYGSA